MKIELNISRISAAAVAMALSLMVATSVNAQVVNGDFQLGTAGWTVEENNITSNTGFGGSTPPLASFDAGNGLVTLQQGNNGGRLAQNVPTTPGSYYELSFWHNNLDQDTAQGSGIQSITWSIGDIGSEIVGPNNFAYADNLGPGNITWGWTQQTEIFQAAAPATRIAFEGTPDSSGGFWGIQLDAVSLTETAAPNTVPEPSTMVLACLVAVGAVMFGWRRRLA